MLDFSNDAGDNWGLPVQTQSTDYSTAPLSDGSPANYVDIPRSEGVTFGGFLNGVTATANSLFDTFGKVYSLQSKAEDVKFTRQVQSAQMDLQRATALGGLDVQRAAIDANNAIEKARAQRAVNDEMARVNSGSAGFVGGKSNAGMMLGLLALGVGFVAWKFGK